MKKIAVFTGNRSEYGLLEPLIQAMHQNTNDFIVQLIVTGSHLSGQFGNTKKYIDHPFTEEVEILADSDTLTGTCTTMGLAMIRIADTLRKMKPDIFIVLGDRHEALAASMAAYNLSIPIAHIQGDDVTLGSLDDGYRRCIRELASIHFDVAEYGSLGCVFGELVNIDDIPCDYLVVYHPSKDDCIQEVYSLRNTIKNLRNVFVILSNQDAHGRCINEVLSSIYSDNFNRGWSVASSVGRGAYQSLLKKAKVIIGNSSSGLIEAPSLGTPTINIGDRQKGRMRASSVIDCDGSIEGIRGAIEKAKQVKFPVNNPYYKNGTIERIIKLLKEIK